MNRLAAETSPYLRQHADNPVDWYPWGDEAFSAARDRDVPVLLSVGYSACHWCHVMAHESFEDAAIAAQMNRDFVNVKVDREERPDVDAIYMDAVQAVTGRGGWPMTVFLTPDGRPFYGGTYFPPEDRGGMPGFPRVMSAVADIWTNRRDEVHEQSDQLVGAIESNTLGSQLAAAGAASTPLDTDDLDAASARVREMFDPVDGGFGPAPKFPASMTIDFLLRCHRRGETGVLEMVTTTLDAMAAGGLYDHVGGGFARYSTDAVWLVPHFEKMLYDQALLAGAYLRAHLVTGDVRYRTVVTETIDYVLARLRHPAGGFFTAEDADSEGIEGKFYLWSPEEIRAVCGPDADEVIDFYGVTQAGNFRDPHTGYSGSILAQVDRRATRPDAVTRCRPLLAAARAERVRPGRDDKVITAWNALFTRSLVESAAALDREDWMGAARDNLRFLLDELVVDGRLRRSWQADGGARHLAVAEDHAALVGALLTAAEYDDAHWLTDAIAIATQLVDLFADETSGGFFTTGADAEALIVRPQDFFDNATPSENSLAADALLRLAAVTGDHRWDEPVRRLLGTLGTVLGQHPTAFGFMLGAYERALGPPVEVAIVGPDAGFARAFASTLHPTAVGIRSLAGTDAGLTPLLEGRGESDATVGYVCEGFVCAAPARDIEAFTAALGAV